MLSCVVCAYIVCMLYVGTRLVWHDITQAWSMDYGKILKGLIAKGFNLLLFQWHLEPFRFYSSISTFDNSI